MAVAVDQFSVGDRGTNNRIFGALPITTAGSTTTLVPIGASATFLLIGLRIESLPATFGTVTITWDDGATNQVMTQIGSYATNSSINRTVGWFGLVNPTVGDNTIRYQVSAAASSFNCDIWGCSLTGTNTTSVAAATEGSATASGDSTSPSVTTSASIPTGDMAFAAAAAPNGATFPSDGGTLFDVGNSDYIELYNGAGSTITASFTQSAAQWCYDIVGVKTPDAPPPTDTFANSMQLLMM